MPVQVLTIGGAAELIETATGKKIEQDEDGNVLDACVPKRPDRRSEHEPGKGSG